MFCLVKRRIDRPRPGVPSAATKGLSLPRLSLSKVLGEIWLVENFESEFRLLKTFDEADPKFRFRWCEAAL